MLSIPGNGEYTVGIPSGNQRSTNGIPMVDPGKVRLGKVSIGKSVEAALPPTRPRFSPPIPPRNPPFCFAPAQRSHPAFTAAAALYIIYKYIYLTLSIILHINRKLYITYNSYYYAHSFFKAGVRDDSRSILSDRQGLPYEPTCPRTHPYAPVRMHCPNSAAPREKNRHPATWFCSDIQRGEGACVIYKPTLASAARLFFRYPPRGGAHQIKPHPGQPQRPRRPSLIAPAAQPRPHHRYNPNTILPIPNSNSPIR